MTQIDNETLDALNGDVVLALNSCEAALREINRIREVYGASYGRELVRFTQALNGLRDSMQSELKLVNERTSASV